MNESIENDSERPISSDEEELTAEKVLQELERAWLTEKFAPEILPHQSDLVDCMLQQITHMEDNMRKLKKGDLRFVVHKMEIDRIRFVLSSYLRTRLEKIEQYSISILTEETKRTPHENYLTPGESKFAKEYLASIETLLRTLGLQHMPAHFQEFEINKLMQSPNLHSHVFLRVIKTVRGVLIPGTMMEEIDLEAGTQHIIQYKVVEHLVKEGAVQLM